MPQHFDLDRIGNAVHTSFYIAIAVLLGAYILTHPLGVFRIVFSFVVLLMVVGIIKVVTRIQRPDRSNHFSFPSGHAAVAWYLVALYGWNPVVVVWAALVSWTRIALKKHYLQDVLTGAAIGALWGHMSR